VLTTYLDSSIQKIRVNGICPSTECMPFFPMSINITGVKNPSSIKPITNLFEIRSFTNEGYIIDYLNMTNFTGIELRTNSFS
jgi:hypothetical protein